MPLSDYLKAWPLYPLPHHAISRLVYRLTRMESKWTQPAIRQFIKAFKVNMSEAEQTDPSAYKTFNAFFTRSLQSELRPIAKGARGLASPVDGKISQVDAIRAGRIVQAKGFDYSVVELLGGDATRAEPFLNGQFTTIYLSPRDYHRIHMPLAGQLLEQVYVPGRLFSVAGHTVRTIPRLFARNERVAAIFETEFGKMALVLVGAINVAAIETVWAGLITPPNQTAVRVDHYPDISLAKGAEMGRFNMGSTVIVLLEKNTWNWGQTQVEQAVKMGMPLAELAD